jgi:hypothetical protein
MTIEQWHKPSEFEVLKPVRMNQRVKSNRASVAPVKFAEEQICCRRAGANRVCCDNARSPNGLVLLAGES